MLHCRWKATRGFKFGPLSLHRALASKGSEGTADEIDDMPEWKQISTWNQISRCFGFVTDVNVVEIPTHVQELLAAELDALESESFPTGNYMRPTDVREEMQQVRNLWDLPVARSASAKRATDCSYSPIELRSLRRSSLVKKCMVFGPTSSTTPALQSR